MSATMTEYERHTRHSARASRQVTLLDLLDRLLGGGVVIRGQIILAAANVDLVALDLGIMVAAIDKASRG
jgi:predicted ATP-dependent serine protease